MTSTTEAIYNSCEIQFAFDQFWLTVLKQTRVCRPPPHGATGRSSFALAGGWHVANNPKLKLQSKARPSSRHEAPTPPVRRTNQLRGTQRARRPAHAAVVMLSRSS